MPAGQRPRVLVIEDDPGVRLVLSYLLAELGLECHTAEDGASGLVDLTKEVGASWSPTSPCRG